ncbi:MAG TPA: hypothetical protein VFE93_06970 [Myxococcaceae bacterium]|nr:hypothetical protein [Myxococcaceae bacterium]
MRSWSELRTNQYAAEVAVPPALKPVTSSRSMLGNAFLCLL